MTQGDEKAGQKGTNSMFVMNQAKIQQTYTDKKTFTYTKIVLDFRPQKDDPHCIHITAGGNLIKCKGDMSTRTADLTTLKLLWNSVLSTCGAKYMCLNTKNSYLMVALLYFEYMKMPLAVFPYWIKNNTILMNTHTRDRSTYAWSMQFGVSPSRDTC